MTKSENWAWWTLGVIALTLIAFFALVAILRSVPASQSAFALMALMALHPRSWRKIKGPQFDEREKEIAEKAQLAAFRTLWVVFIGVVMTIGFVKGWNTTLSMPIWILSATICWAAMLVLAVESGTTLVLYRRG